MKQELRDGQHVTFQTQTLRQSRGDAKAEFYDFFKEAWSIWVDFLLVFFGEGKFAIQIYVKRTHNKTSNTILTEHTFFQVALAY